MSLSSEPWTANTQPHTEIRLCGVALEANAHVCAFFHDEEEAYRTLLPFIRDGLNTGERAVHTLNPARIGEHLAYLQKAGLDTRSLIAAGDRQIQDWDETHLKGCRFNPTETLGIFEAMIATAQSCGYPMVRFVTQMEWALEAGISGELLLEYEARANQVRNTPGGYAAPVICVYDLRRFSGRLIVEVMRTHPYVVIGGLLQRNPFFVPPDDFLRELRTRSRVDRWEDLC